MLLIVRYFSDSFSSSFSLQHSKGDHSYIFQAPSESIREEEVSLLDYVEDAVLVFDRGGFLLHCNQSAVVLYRSKLGYLESIQGMHYDNLSLDGTNFWSGEDNFRIVIKQLSMTLFQVKYYQCSSSNDYYYKRYQ